MPAQKTSRKTLKYNNKKLNKKQFKNMILDFASPNAVGFKYLHLFKYDDWQYIANHLKDSPTVFEVVNFALLNKFTIAEYKIKPTRLDEVRMFDIEAEPMAWVDGIEYTRENNWWEIKDFMFFVGNNYENYRFM
jgi:hypothetical protein